MKYVTGDLIRVSKSTFYECGGTFFEGQRMQVIAVPVLGAEYPSYLVSIEGLKTGHNGSMGMGIMPYGDHSGLFIIASKLEDSTELLTRSDRVLELLHEKKVLSVNRQMAVREVNSGYGVLITRLFELSYVESYELKSLFLWEVIESITGMMVTEKMDLTYYLLIEKTGYGDEPTYMFSIAKDVPDYFDAMDVLDETHEVYIYDWKHECYRSNES